MSWCPYYLDVRIKRARRKHVEGMSKEGQEAPNFLKFYFKKGYGTRVEDRKKDGLVKIKQVTLYCYCFLKVKLY